MERRWQIALGCVLIVFTIYALLHAVTTPRGATGYQDAPDEAAHTSVVRAVANGRLPSRGNPAPVPHEGTPPSYEWHQPPLYYVLAAPLAGAGAVALRCVNVVLGLGAVLAIWWGVRLFDPEDSALAVAAAGIAAFTPTHIALCSAVTNDILLELLFTATLIAVMGAAHSGFTPGRAGWIGLFIAGAILTKTTGLLLLPLLGIAGVTLLSQGAGAKALLGRGIYILMIILVGTGWWFVRNRMLYGEILPLRAFNEAFGGTMQASEVARALHGWGAYARHMALGTFCSYWAVFGTRAGSRLGIPEFMPLELYGAYAALVAAGAYGLARLHWERASRFSAEQLGVIRLSFASVLVVAAAYILFILKYYQMQGRYLYPAMFPISLLLALGLRRTLGPLWYKGAPSAILFGMGLMAGGFMMIVTGR